MAANSKHWGDVYKWIEHMIETCDDKSQKSSMNNMVRNFRKNCVKRDPFNTRYVVHSPTVKFNKNIEKLASDLELKAQLRFIWLESAKYAEGKERAKDLAV